MEPDEVLARPQIAPVAGGAKPPVSDLEALLENLSAEQIERLHVLTEERAQAPARQKVREYLTELWPLKDAPQGAYQCRESAHVLASRMIAHARDDERGQADLGMALARLREALFYAETATRSTRSG